MAKFLDLPNKFYSRKTWRRGAKIAGVGEQEPQETTYDKGANSLGYRGQARCGKRAAWSTGGVSGVDEPLQLDPDGWSECCGPRTYPLGGIELYGDTFISIPLPYVLGMSTASGTSAYWHAKPPGVTTEGSSVIVVGQFGSTTGGIPDTFPVGSSAAWQSVSSTIYERENQFSVVSLPSQGIFVTPSADTLAVSMQAVFSPTVAGSIPDGAATAGDSPQTLPGITIAALPAVLVLCYVADLAEPMPPPADGWELVDELVVPGYGVVGIYYRVMTTTGLSDSVTLTLPSAGKVGMRLGVLYF